MLYTYKMCILSVVLLSFYLFTVSSRGRHDSAFLKENFGKSTSRVWNSEQLTKKMKIQKIIAKNCGILLNLQKLGENKTLGVLIIVNKKVAHIKKNWNI